MSEQTATVRTNELRPGDRVWHPFDIVPFTVAHTPKAETGLHFEGEPGLRVTGTNTRGETVHVDVAPAYEWRRAPITNTEDAVREMGALPVPVGSEPQMTAERLAEIRDLIRYVSSIAFYSHRAKESVLLLVAEAEAAAKLRTRVAELEEQLLTLNTQRGDVAELIERERGHGEECVDIDALTGTLGLGADEIGGAA